MELSDNKSRLAYGWQWLWFAMVGSASLWCYVQLVELISVVVWKLPAMSAFGDATDEVVLTALKVLAGALFCWRVVKVVVLHGSPIPWGLTLSSGRENGGVSGRRVHFASIEGVSKIWFGAVMRAHPASDKLMRTRLEFLIVALPFGRGLMVSESRILWISKSKEEQRLQYFLRVARKYKYMKPPESKSLDQFRHDVVRRLDEIAKRFRDDRDEKRIDGLTWEFPLNDTIYIRDDSGCRLACHKLDGERFAVNGLGSEASEEEATIVDSLDALRELAKQKLHPAYR